MLNTNGHTDGNGNGNGGHDDPGRLDVRFAVPTVHRLRFTHDVLGADREVLLDLLEPSGDRPRGSSSGSTATSPRPAPT